MLFLLFHRTLLAPAAAALSAPARDVTIGTRTAHKRIRRSPPPALQSKGGFSVALIIARVSQGQRCVLDADGITADEGILARPGTSMHSKALTGLAPRPARPQKVGARFDCCSPRLRGRRRLSSPR